MRSFTPHPYQKIGTEFLCDVPRASLWAGMGMGKTVTTLTLLEATRLGGDGPSLILAPKRVAKNVWPAEVEKWSHLREFKISPVVGDIKARLAALKVRADAYTLNYENLPWLFEWLTENHYAWPFDAVVCDEATRLKSMRPSMQVSKAGKEYVRAAGGKRARQLARIAHTKVNRWINLTGTPAPAGLQDLWGQQWFVDAGARLGRTYDSYTQRWFRPKYNTDKMNHAKQQIAGIEPLQFAAQEINDRLRDCSLSLRAEDWFDVKKPLVTPVWIDLPPKARKAYNEMEKKLFTELAGIEVEAFNGAAKTNKCLQMAAGIVYYGEAEDATWAQVHDARLDALDSIIEEAAGEPVLVQYHWRPDQKLIMARFPQARVLDDKKSTEDAWNAGRIPVLLAHAKSAGHGLNLQDGGYILARYSYWWAREEFDQILERIGPVRQLQSGHNRVVRDIRIIARDTLDEAMLARHETNRETEDILMEYMARKA